MATNVRHETIISPATTSERLPDRLSSWQVGASGQRLEATGNPLLGVVEGQRYDVGRMIGARLVTQYHPPAFPSTGTTRGPVETDSSIRA